MRKSNHSLTTCFKFAIIGAIALLGAIPVIAENAPEKAKSPETKYEPTWESVNKHNPGGDAPEWFKDAKFGIYFHWGAYSVASFGSEWYPRNMYDKKSGEYRHHLETYGDPYGDWPYQNFIDGAKDKKGNWVQFAPKLKSDGGNFDPDEWAQLFVDAGAKFAGPSMEHHDGFSMWDSQVNEWNSVAKGPKLNLAALFTKAIRAKGLKLFAALHQEWNYGGYFQYAPVPEDPSLKKLFGKLPLAEEQTLWYAKQMEVVNKFQPDIIWNDNYVNNQWVGDKNILNFLANYYNQAVSLKKEVVVAIKEGQMNHDCAVLDYERGGPGNVTPFYWLSDDTVSPSSWCYVEGMKYYTVTQEIHSLIDKVSKNGNLLLNISPKPDGTIPQAQKDILLGMGDWLKKFGESIYSTRAWTVYGEGPTHMGGGAFTAPVNGTKQDIRFTRNKAGDTLYAIVLDWPGDGAILNIQSLKSSRIDLSSLKKVELLGEKAGNYMALKTYAQDKTGLKITMPAQSPYTAAAYAIKLTFSGKIPELSPEGYPKANAEKTGEGAEQAFDGNSNTKWYTDVNGATGWLQYQFPKSETRTVSLYKLTSANDAPERDPMDWELQGSNDGTNWTTLDAKKGETFEKRRMTKTYTISTPAAYNIYQLNITANKGGAANAIQLAELAFTYVDSANTEPIKTSQK